MIISKKHYGELKSLLAINGRLYSENFELKQENKQLKQDIAKHKEIIINRNRQLSNELYKRVSLTNFLKRLLNNSNITPCQKNIIQLVQRYIACFDKNLK